MKSRVLTSIAVTLRRTGVVVLAGVATVLGAPAAQAEPVPNFDNLPTQLRMYIPGSPEWASAPWMTSPTCARRGGDFSVWTASVMRDAPELLKFFQSSLFDADIDPATKARGVMIAQGYRTLADKHAGQVPAAYCVDDVRRWAAAEPQVKPFGFPWGVTKGGGHRTIYACVDRGPNPVAEVENNRWFGAERLPCDGFYVDCVNAQEIEKERCGTWNNFSDTYVRQVGQMRANANNTHPSSGDPGPFGLDTELKSPGEIADDIAGGWFAELTKTIAEGSANLMAQSMTFWTSADRSEMLTTPAIAEIHALLRYIGLTLLTAGVIWQGIVMMYRRKVDPLVTIGSGLLLFVGWSTLGGVIAVMMHEAGIALSRQVLGESIADFSKAIGESLVGQYVAATGVVFFLSILLFLLACIQWVLGFFRAGALIVLLALLPTAAAGQLTERTKPWLSNILSWCMVLLLHEPISSVIFAVGLKFIGSGRDIATVLTGMAVITLAVVCLPAMRRFFDWGGQRLVNSGNGGGGGAMAAGAAVSMLGGGGGGFGRHMDQSGPASGGRSSGALPVSSAHRGDGPGGGTSGSGGQRTATGALPTGTSAAPGSGGGATAAGGARSPGTAASGAGTGSAAAGGAAAAAGPAGVAAQAGKEAISKGAKTASGAMTDGVGEGGSK